ncbi:MAG TPA: DUF2027 domain-containing protein [Prolixibacteraceae bacterium]|nr:DUF2027 domain-containing protein [Prolixibacteraceae bacterium]HPS12954.1 DUF2027 domain-containing protein [Prolixibacteraceae bacterium]
MLNIGDKVKFLNDVGGGTITGFQSKNIAVVENQDGFEIPVMINQLVKTEDAMAEYGKVNRDFSKKPEPKKPEPAPEPVHKAEIIPGNDDPKFFMAFYPTNQENPVGGEIEVYLINDSNFTLLFHYCHFNGETYKTVEAGELEPNTKSYLEGISQADLNNLPKFWFRIIPYRNEEKKLTAPVVKDVEVNPLKFYKEKSFSKCSFFKGKAMVFDLAPNPMTEEIGKLTEKDFKQVVKAKDAENRPEEPKKPKKRTPEIVEVDLHIHELIENSNGLTNHEILQIQMDKFQSEMKSAIEGRVNRIVFIHGVGNGVLKQEIHKKLKSTYAKYFFQDASFQEYGYGATMVILRRK